MSMYEQASNDLRDVRSVMLKLGKTFQDFQSYSFSIIALDDQWRNLQKSCVAINNRLEVRVREVEVKERELDMIKNQVENFHAQIELKQKRLELEEKSWRERNALAEVKEKEVKELCEALEVREFGVAKRDEIVALREKDVQEREGKLAKDVQELERKKKDVNERVELLASEEVKEKQLDEKLKQIEVKEKELDDRSNVLMSEEKKLDELRNVLECRGKIIDERGKVLATEVEEVKEQKKGLECKEKQLDADLKQSESKEKELDDRSNVLMSKEKEIDELRNELECKEKNINERVKLLVTEVEDIREKHKGLEAREKQLDEKFRQIESKEKELDDHRKVLELKEKELDESYQSVVSKNEELNKSCHLQLIDKDGETQRVLSNCQGEELREQQTVSNGSTQIKQELPDSAISKVDSVDCPPSPKIGGDIVSLCRSMNADGVRLFVIKHVIKQNMYQEKILDALRSAPDPAKLVFNVSQGLFQNFQQKKKKRANESSCIFLMEQLMKCSPTFSPDMRDEATHFGACLIARLEQQWKTNSPADCYGVLQFIATFKLASYFNNSNQLLSFLKKVYSNGPGIYRHKQHISLCHELGLLEKIPGVIKDLIARKKWLMAIDYICVFKLESDFPPVPLLENRLDDLYQKINENKKAKKSKKIVVEQTELSSLKFLVRYATCYNLKSKRFPLYALLSRIKELENKATENKRPCDAVAEPTRKRSASSPCASVASLEQLEKRPRVDNVHQPAPPP